MQRGAQKLQHGGYADDLHALTHDLDELERAHRLTLLWCMFCGALLNATNLRGLGDATLDVGHRLRRARAREGGVTLLGFIVTPKASSVSRHARESMKLFTDYSEYGAFAGASTPAGSWRRALRSRSCLAPRRSTSVGGTALYSGGRRGRRRGLHE